MNSKIHTVQEVINILEDRLELQNLPAINPVLCVDGTACCFKSSILEQIRRQCDLSVKRQDFGGPLSLQDTHSSSLSSSSSSSSSSLMPPTPVPLIKVSRAFPTACPNTYGAGLLGYVASGELLLRTATQPTLCDRSPLNSIEWLCLWQQMTAYVDSYHNVTPSWTREKNAFCDNDQNSEEWMSSQNTQQRSNENTYDNEDTEVESGDSFEIGPMTKSFASLSSFTSMWDALLALPMYASKRAQINCIAIVNSNTELVRRLMRKRQEGSDYERANWNYYVPLQNLMYSSLYKGLCIDLDWFGEEACLEKQSNGSPSVVIEGIALFLKSALNYVENKWRKQPQSHQNSSTKVFLPPALPTSCRDYTTSNMKAHVLRSLMRTSANSAFGGGLTTFATPSQSLKRTADVTNLSVITVYKRNKVYCEKKENEEVEEEGEEEKDDALASAATGLLYRNCSDDEGCVDNNNSTSALDEYTNDDDDDDDDDETQSSNCFKNAVETESDNGDIHQDEM